VRTDELIERLSAETRGGRLDSVPARLSGATVAGAAGALLILFAWLRIRPDIAQAVTTWTWWLKVAYGLALAAAGFAAVERLARPAGLGRRGLGAAAAALAVLLALGGLQLATAAPGARMAIWLGRSWLWCPFNILALSGPMLVAGLAAARTLAPTRPALTGAAAGLLAGGTAMAVYCLHCPETEPAFVATWYSLGAVLSAAAGALAGPLVLRWR
jgi:hypothetical protein